MVKHIVMFRLSGSAEDRRAAAEKWDVVLTATVPTMADVDVYAKHPAHVAAASLLAACKEERACVDYEC